MSCDDRRALSVMEKTIQLKDGHYELALPWKNPPPALPKNRPLAERRLKFLKRRLEKDSELLLKYSTFMDDFWNRATRESSQTKNVRNKAMQHGIYPTTQSSILTSLIKCELFLTVQPSTQEHITEQGAVTGAEFNKQFSRRADAFS